MEELDKLAKKVTNHYAKVNRLKSKLRTMEKISEELNSPLHFITATLNDKYEKDRYNINTIRNAVKNAFKGAKTRYYVFIIEQHKDGAYHGHIIMIEKEVKNFLKKYKGGFTKDVKGYGNIDNELTKYLAKQKKEKRYHFASWWTNRINEARKEENIRYYLEKYKGEIK